MHPHGAMAEPRARRESHAGHLGEGSVLLRVEPLEHVATAARLDRIHDLIEAVPQDPLGVHPYREHVRYCHGRTDDVGNEAVPHSLRVLGAADRAVSTTAPAKGVPEGPMIAVHVGGDDARYWAQAALARYAAIVGSATPTARAAATVRLQEEAATREGEPDLVLLTARPRREVLAIRHRRDVLEEPSLIQLLRGEVDREPGLRTGESAVDVAMANRRSPPLIDVDVGICEELVERPRCGHCRHGAHGTSGRSSPTSGPGPNLVVRESSIRAGERAEGQRNILGPGSPCEPIYRKAPRCSNWPRICGSSTQIRT